MEIWFTKKPKSSCFNCITNIIQDTGIVLFLIIKSQDSKVHVYSCTKIEFMDKYFNFENRVNFFLQFCFIWDINENPVRSNNNNLLFKF